MLINLEYAWSANNPPVTALLPFDVGSEDARVAAWLLRTPIEKRVGSVEVCKGSGCTILGAGASTGCGALNAMGDAKPILEAGV
jgi:hypothetical protein